MSTPPEQILIRTHPSRLFSLGYYAAAVFLLLVSGGLLLNTFLQWFSFPAMSTGPLTLEGWLVAVGATLAVVLVLIAEIRRIATTFTLTDFRVVRK